MKTEKIRMENTINLLRVSNINKYYIAYKSTEKPLEQKKRIKQKRN